MKDLTNKKFWQLIAKIYAPIAETDKNFYKKLCAHIIGHMRRDMDVLELACGSGQLTFTLSKYAARYIATDFSDKMIAEAKRRGSRKNLRFRTADATALPFKDGSFDCIVIANALHIMPEPDKAMREIARVLKPNGILYAPTFLWAENGANQLRKCLMSLAGFKVYREWERESFGRFVGEYGFRVTEMKLVNGGIAPVGTLIAIKK